MFNAKDMPEEGPREMKCLRKLINVVYCVEYRCLVRWRQHPKGCSEMGVSVPCSHDSVNYLI